MLLAHQLVQRQGASPAHWVVFIHGVLGRGANWQTFARKLVTARPELGAVLLDLRKHGDSQAQPPPHTFEAAVSDVLALLDTLRKPLLAVVGHSYGGKVALKLLEQRPDIAREAWVLDASPSARAERSGSDSTQRVLDALVGLPETFPSRNAFAQTLASRGLAPALGAWLAKNLVREGEHLRFGLDMHAIGELLADHDRQDLWSVVSASDRPAKLRFVLGGRSTTVSPQTRARLAELASRGRIELMDLPEAGHWIHADDPEGLLGLLQQRLNG